jgi:hypothetical protein
VTVPDKIVTKSDKMRPLHVKLAEYPLSMRQALRLELVILLGMAILLTVAAGKLPGLDNDRATLITALRAHHVLIPGRQLLRVAYLCSVEIGGDAYPLVDIFEQVPGAMEPRGVARIELLDQSLAPVLAVAYAPPAAPLFCKDSSVYFSGDVTVCGSGSGNKVTFLMGGAYVKMDEVDLNDLPAPVEK